MQNIKNKNALSPIIATVLIIVLALASISILWVVVKKVANPDALLSPKQCIDYQTEPPYKITKSCYNITSSETEVTLKKSLYQEKTQEIKFIIYNSKENSNSFKCGDNCNNCDLPSDSKKYFFNSEIKPTEIKLIIDDCIIAGNKISDC